MQWYFPLGSGRGYIGAGDIDRRYYGMKEFFEENPDVRVVKKIGRPIRLSPPTRMQPFFNKNIIGVGESIGCVFPITGVGIGPSLMCSEIFINILDRNGNNFNFQDYTTEVLDVFGFYDDVYQTLRLTMDRKLNRFIMRLQDLKKIFLNQPKAASFIK